MRLVGVGAGFPPHYYDQATLLAELKEIWKEKKRNPATLDRLHRNVLVNGRHLALPLEAYRELNGWGDANDAWIRVAVEVGEAAVRDALAVSGLAPRDIGTLLFTTVTGIATPSIDARLMNRLGLPASVRRLPLFGLGCVAGAAGIARASDFVKAWPDEAAVVLSVELCSLTLQREDLSVRNLIATGLFGDGAAAAVVVGENRESTGPRVLGSRSVFYPDTEKVMGWHMSERGFGLILSAEVPEMVRRHLRRDVDDFLGSFDLDRSGISRWISHPGGPKVLEAMQEALELPDGALDSSWRSLQELGNLSSSSVLMVLKDTMENNRPPQGSYGLILAMGPGFCTELVLLQW